MNRSLYPILLPLLLAASLPAQAQWWNPFSGDGCLKGVEQAAQAYQKCRVNQSVPRQCGVLKQQLAQAKIQCANDKMAVDKIAAAEKQGTGSVSGTPSKSPYARVTRSLSRSPYFVRPELDNYLPFTADCKKSSASYFKIGAYDIKQRTAKMVVYPLGSRCSSPNAISEKYPVVTAAQLRDLESGVYVKARTKSKRPYDSVKIVRTTADKLQATYKGLSAPAAAAAAKPAPSKGSKRKQFRLSVVTEPRNARVRLLNVNRAYKDRVSLPPGRYQVQVSASGYRTGTYWVTVGKSDKTVKITLVAARAANLRKCEEYAEDLLVDTFKIARFGSCHFLTYPGKSSRDLRIVNQREKGHIHDVKVRVSYFDADKQVIEEEEYVLFRADRKEGIAPGQTGFPFTSIYLHRDGVKAIGIKTENFQVSNR